VKEKIQKRDFNIQHNASSQSEEKGAAHGGSPEETVRGSLFPCVKFSEALATTTEWKTTSKKPTRENLRTAWSEAHIGGRSRIEGKGGRNGRISAKNLGAPQKQVFKESLEGEPYHSLESRF